MTRVRPSVTLKLCFWRAHAKSFNLENNLTIWRKGLKFDLEWFKRFFLKSCHLNEHFWNCDSQWPTHTVPTHNSHTQNSHNIQNSHTLLGFTKMWLSGVGTVFSLTSFWCSLKTKYEPKILFNFWEISYRFLIQLYGELFINRSRFCATLSFIKI